MSEFNDSYNPNPSKERFKTYCLECGFPLAVNESVYNKNKYGHFCTRECYWKWKSNNIVGENHPQYKRNIVSCDNCSESIDITDYNLERTQHHFCSFGCYAEFRSKYYVGDKSFWHGKLRPEISESSRKNMLKILKEGKIKNHTEIHQKINSILSSMQIDFSNEKEIGHYSVDIYLENSQLIIEVMGDYWHANPCKYKSIEELDDVQLKDIRRDKRKQTYIRKYHGVNILYLWESDIKKNPSLCKLLIKEYVDKKGVLDNYHSFNYQLKDGNLLLNGNIIKPLWEK
jgi:G:T-mismatch repair DNA endonuclease (very short patch repair protein)